MPRPPSAFIWVQHLLGIGHLVRAARLARHLASSGWQVELASGGAPIAALDLGRAVLHQLPPVRSADPEFSALVEPAGGAIDQAWGERRRDALLERFARARPDILVLEHFPFGRRQFGFELDPLLAAARVAVPRPKMVCSVRDILVERKPEREAETVAALRRDFDAVLVHGDPALARLEDSFRAAPSIAEKLVYTGFIAAAADMSPRVNGEDGEIVVSAGGGAVGERLAAAALAAAGRLALSWRLLVGGNVTEPDFARLRALAPARMIVERVRLDFRRLLASAALSVSQAGYNTVVDLLVTGARAILVPFDRLRETEQTLRASRLAASGLARIVPEARLSGETLGAMVVETLATSRPVHRLSLEGEVTSERALRRLLVGTGTRP